MTYLFYVRFLTFKYRTFLFTYFFLNSIPLHLFPSWRIWRRSADTRSFPTRATTLQSVPLHWTSDFLISLPAAHCRERKGNGVAFFFFTSAHFHTQATTTKKKNLTTTPTFRHSPVLTYHPPLSAAPQTFEFECQFPLYRNLIVHHGIYVLICLISSLGCVDVIVPKCAS